MSFSSFFSRRGSSRKGQGLSLNVVIVAVIALIVLVVLVVIFSGKVKVFSSATSSCESKQGECFDSCPGGYVTMYGAKCADGKVCCSPLDADLQSSDAAS